MDRNLLSEASTIPGTVLVCCFATRRECHHGFYVVEGWLSENELSVRLLEATETVEHESPPWSKDGITTPIVDYEMNELKQLTLSRETDGTFCVGSSDPLELYDASKRYRFVFFMD